MIRVHPELEAMYAIPNARKASVRAMVYYKAEGLKTGMPDIHLPVPRSDFASLYIEMKRSGKGAAGASDEQKKKHALLTSMGNMVVVCHGFTHAVEVLLNYLKLPGPRRV